MARDMPRDAKILQEEVRRQFGSPRMSRYAHALPLFQVDHRIPERFVNLLSELEHAEADRSNAGHTAPKRRG